MAAISFQPYATLEQQNMALVGKPLHVTLVNFNRNTLVTLELVSAKTGCALSNTTDIKFEATVIPTSNAHVMEFTFLQTTYVMMEEQGIYIRASSGNTSVNSIPFHVIFNVAVCNGSVRIDTVNDVQDLEFMYNLLDATFRYIEKLRDEIDRLRKKILQPCPDTPIL